VRSRRGGIAIGLLLLIVYYEALNFGDAMAKRDLLAPELGLWLPFALLLLGVSWLLLRALLGQRPMAAMFGRGPQPAMRPAA
jgi:lipopolysaccharide export LptBFGC system permease protein LptF